MNTILAKHTNKAVSTLEKDTNRDNFMSAAEAMEYGLVDSILATREEVAQTAKA